MGREARPFARKARQSLPKERDTPARRGETRLAGAMQSGLVAGQGAERQNADGAARAAVVVLDFWILTGRAMNTEPLGT